MEKIPRIIFLGIIIIVVGLGVLNVFAPKLGLERDPAITGLFCLVVGIIMRFVLAANDKDKERKD